MESQISNGAATAIGAVITGLFGWIFKHNSQQKLERQEMKARMEKAERLIEKQATVCAERAKDLDNNSNAITDMQRDISEIKAAVARIEGRLLRND